MAEPANEEGREEKSPAPGMIDKWTVGWEDWKGYAWWRLRQFGFASFRPGVSLRHPDGDSQKVSSETGMTELRYKWGL